MCRVVTTRGREAEKYKKLKAVARERLVKNLQAVEVLVFAALICRVWILAVEL
jgi:hypothetical protein